MITYIKWQIGFGILSIVLRAFFLARNEYPRISTQSPAGDVVAIALMLGFVWWAVSVIS